MRVGVVLPVFNEDERLAACLDSLFAQQDAPPYEVLVVDSYSTDETAMIAQRYPVGLIEAPRGKLTARTIGIEAAWGDVIVAVDGDSTYPPFWLHLLLRHFADPDVVAVTGPRIFTDMPALNFFTQPFHLVFRAAHHMYGGNSAFRKAAFYETGGFRPVNQLDVRVMVGEEEVAFGDRLARVGRYVLDYDAFCYTSARRWFSERHKLERLSGQRF